MNREICKRCEEIKPWKFSHYEYFNPFKECPPHVVVMVNKDGKDEPELCCCKMVSNNANNGERIYHKKIRLTDKDCPYWLEHQMYDWNQRKTKNVKR